MTTKSSDPENILLSAFPVDQQGTATVPSFEVPLSSYLSPEAKAFFIERFRETPDWRAEDIQAARAKADQLLYEPHLARIRRRYKCTAEAAKIGGVRVDVIVPAAGLRKENEKRILICLHGGGFEIGAGIGAQVEAIPIAANAGIKVIAVDYRQGPEHQFPEAREDVAAVYRELLREYQPQQIGIYGCSAGAMLTAMVLPWFARDELPRPGAIGLLSGAASPIWGGDSWCWGYALTGSRAPAGVTTPLRLAFFNNADPNDPLISPEKSAATLAQFPPTVLVTGGRDFAFSASIEAHRQLLRSGVAAKLHVWEGMWHAFFYNADLPESREVFDVVARFFTENLG